MTTYGEAIREGFNYTLANHDDVIALGLYLAILETYCHFCSPIRN